MSEQNIVLCWTSLACTVIEANTPAASSSGCRSAGPKDRRIGARAATPHWAVFPSRKPDRCRNFKNPGARRRLQSS
jgi:hypothetical protein